MIFLINFSNIIILKKKFFLLLFMNLGIAMRNVERLSIVRIGLDLFEKEGLIKQKYGIKYKMLCPFHEEKHASFFINPLKGEYRCYGCGLGGGPLSLISRVFKGEYLEIFMYLESQECDLEKEVDILETLMQEESERYEF